MSKRKYLKRITLALTLFAATALITGCGDDDNTDDEQPDTTMEDVSDEDTTMSDDTMTSDTETPDDTQMTDDTDQEAETAQVMVIHNAADPGASEVDVFLNGELLANDFAFRTAIPFTELPAGDHTIQIAPSSAADSEGTSLSDDTSTLGSFDVSLEAGGSYLAVASGVRPGEGFAENPGDAEIALDLKIKSGAKVDSAEDSSTDEVLMFHGVTDAPAIDARINNAVDPQISELAYGEFTEYLPLPAGVHTIDAQVASSDTRLTSLQTAEVTGGDAWVVVASGFLRPNQNNGGMPLDGIAFRAQTSSETDLIEGVPLEKAARIQLVHAAPQSAVETVDVSLVGQGRTLAEEVSYETATPFVSVPGGIDLNVGVSPSSEDGDPLVDQTVNFDNGVNQVVVASGVTDPANFENVDSANFALRPGTVEVPGPMVTPQDDGSVDVNIFHGATDAPAVDLVGPDGSVLLGGLAFGSFSGVTQLPAQDTTVTVRPEGGGEGSGVASFDLPLSGLGAEYRTIVASGFLTPDGDPVDASTFKLLAISADGSVASIEPK